MKLLEGRSQRERVMILAGAGVALLALAFLLLKALGGGGEDLGGPVGPPIVRRSPTPSPSVAPSPLPVTGGMFGRDPFQPLVREDGGGADGGGGGDTGGAGGTSKRVTLLDIFRSGGELNATVSVDGTEFTVAEGETFDTSFRLLSLTTRCGTFVFGDERFTLCVGQEIRK